MEQQHRAQYSHYRLTTTTTTNILITCTPFFLHLELVWDSNSTRNIPTPLVGQQKQHNYAKNRIGQITWNQYASSTHGWREQNNRWSPTRQSSFCTLSLILYMYIHAWYPRLTWTRATPDGVFIVDVISCPELSWLSVTYCIQGDTFPPFPSLPPQGMPRGMPHQAFSECGRSFWWV